MAGFRLIIAGGREYRFTKDDREQLDMVADMVDEVVCGMARGADLEGKAWAESHGIPVAEFPADWDTHGRKAGYLRNLEMAENADGVALFPGGRGTEMMHEIALKKKLVIWDYRRSQVVHCHREDYDVYIGRSNVDTPFSFGNPFITGRDGNRSTVIFKYEQWLRKGTTYRNPDAMEDQRQYILKNLAGLKHSRLGCHCRPKTCHGDVLVKLIKEQHG